MLYLNSMLFSVNARDWIKEGSSTFVPTRKSISGPVFHLSASPQLESGKETFMLDESPSLHSLPRT